MENKYTKNCPLCGKEMLFKTKVTLKKSINSASKCMKCNNNGENNPFFGKTHTEENKNKFRENNRINIEKYKSLEFKQKLSKIFSGENNPMSKKSFYDIWIEKYGLEIAEIKMNEFRKKQSDNNIGEKNGI
jgi:hypothetical protein